VSRLRMVLATAGGLEKVFSEKVLSEKVLSAGREQSATARVREAAAVGVAMRMAECLVSEGALVAMNEEREASVRAASVRATVGGGMAMLIAECGAEAVQGRLQALLEDTGELEDSKEVMAEDLNKAV